MLVMIPKNDLPQQCVGMSATMLGHYVLMPSTQFRTPILLKRAGQWLAHHQFSKLRIPEGVHIVVSWNYSSSCGGGSSLNSITWLCVANHPKLWGLPRLSVVFLKWGKSQEDTVVVAGSRPACPQMPCLPFLVVEHHQWLAELTIASQNSKLVALLL